MAVSIGVLFSPTSPATTTLANGRVRFTNTSNAAQAITWYAVPNAGSPGAGNCQMNAESLSANAHVDVDVPLLGPGATIQAFAANASDVTISALAGVLFS
jgi:hypothetical protein